MRWVVVCTAVCVGCAAPGAGRRDASSDRPDVSLAPDAASHDGRVPFEECASETTRAETRLRPVDIVWIVDRSGSMSGEARIVQDNINDFARAIDRSGIDYHVVMVSAMAFIQVPPPLGDDPMRFRYVEEDVQSNDGLIDLVDRFPDYGDFLRADAVTHFIAVTDDESERMSWTDFRSRMEASLGHQFTFHAIVSPPGSTHCVESPFGGCVGTENGCSGPNGDAAENGAQYWELAAATGGQRLSICTEDWSGLFSTLTAAIAVPMRLPCRFRLPEPPPGMVLDRMFVNVVYTPTGASEGIVIPHVGDAGACTGSGWYYEGDDIVVCPATCATLSSDASGRVDIALGCETVLI